MQLSKVILPLSSMAWIACAVLASCCANAANPPTMKKMDCLIVRNAMIPTNAVSKNTSSETELGKANYGHQVMQGQTYVAVIRVYEDDGSGVDAAKFQKLTLELDNKSVEPLANQNLDVAVTRGYYTEGGVGFIHKGEYWRSTEFPKSIRLRKTHEGIALALQAELSGVKESDGTKRKVALDISCPARFVQVQDLNPWTGKVGTGWNSFGPPD